MSDELASPVTEPSAARPGPPPLRIHHFLAATVVAAVLLSISHAVQHGEPSALLGYFRSGLGFIGTIVVAVAATIVGFGFVWRLEGRSFFDLPGHWLLLQRALSVATFLVAGLAEAIHHTSEYALVGLWSGVQMLATCVISLWVAIRVADTWLWRLYFLLSASTIVLMPLTARFVGPSWLMLVWMIISIILAGMLFSAGAGDLIAGRRRDWPHWLGVALTLGVVTTSVAQNAWHYLAANG
jgi:hypothetical protein